MRQAKKCLPQTLHVYQMIKSVNDYVYFNKNDSYTLIANSSYQFDIEAFVKIKIVVEHECKTKFQKKTAMNGIHRRILNLDCF